MVCCLGGEVLAQAQSVSYRYDNLGRVVQVTYSDGASVTYAYDKAGNRTQQTSTPRPPPPTVSPVTANVAYNAATAIALAPSGAYTSLSVVSSPAKGAVSINGATATYTPQTGYYGGDSFTYKAVGPGGESAPAGVAITVAVPAAPTVSNVSASTAYQTPLVVSGNPAGVWTAVNRVTSPANGVAVGDGDRSWTYTPNSGFYGSDSWTYTATGPGGTSAPATVSITVGLPSAPTVSAKTISTAYNTAGSVNLAPTGVSNSVAVASGPTRGSVSISGTTATYTPTPGTYGSDSFTFTATGPGGTSTPATVAVTVAAPPAPGASDAVLSVGYNSTASLTLPISGVATGAVLDTAPAKGTVSFSGTTATYKVTWPNYGADSFTYHATGPGGSSAVRTVNVLIGNPPIPSSADGSASTAYNSAVAITYPVTGDYAEVALDSTPAHGSVSTPGHVAGVGHQSIYTPHAGYYGPDSWTFHAYTAGGAGVVRTFTINVAPPAAPTVSAKTISTAYNTAGSVNLAPTGVSNSVAVASGPTRGSVSISGTTATYTPTPGTYGSDSFTFTATGPGGTSTPATVAVTVAAPPAPGASDAVLSVGYNSTASLNLPISGVATGAVLDAAPAKGSVSFSGNTATYKVTWPNYGADSFTYHAIGPGGSSAVRTVNVSIGNPPIPSSANGSASTAYNTAVAITYPVTGDYAEVALDATPAHGSVSTPGHVAGVGHQSIYTPHAGYYGPDSWTFHAYTAGGAGVVRTFTINVAPPPAPSAGATSLSVLSLTSGSVQLQPGGVYSGVAISAQPAHGSVSLNGATATYTPSGAYVGSDSFSYVASGPGGSSAPGTVSVTVQNRAPTANPEAALAVPGNPITLSPLDNDTDPEGQSLTIIAASGGGPGSSLSFNGSTIVYTPWASEPNGSQRRLSYTISDGHGGTASSYIDVTMDYSGDGQCHIDPNTGECVISLRRTVQKGQS